jgi:tRNA(fMet)-specific endonuclease VapC
MYLLDTNICIYILKRKPIEVFERFKTLKLGELKISSITVAELYYGAYNSQKIEKNLMTLDSFLKPFDYVEFNEKSAIEYAKIKSNLKRKGTIIGELDMQIAAVARANDLILITNNVKEFERVNGLKVSNWVES